MSIPSKSIAAFMKAFIAALALAAIPALSQTQLPYITRVGTVDPIRNLVYTTGANPGPNGSTIPDGTIHVIDGKTSQMATYNVGATGPIVLNAVTNKIYIGGANEVVELDGATHASTHIPLEISPSTMALNIATNKVYALQGSSIAVVDVNSHAVTRVALGTVPRGIGINTATNKIYFSGANVQVLDGSTNTVTTLPVSADGHVVGISTSANKVYIVTREGQPEYTTATVIDGNTNAATTMPIGTLYFGNYGYNVSNLAVNPVTDKAYAADGANFGATGVAVNTSTNMVYTSSSRQCHICSGGGISTTDGATGAFVSSDTTHTGKYVTVDPIINKLYVFEQIVAQFGSVQSWWYSLDGAAGSAPTNNSPLTSIAPLPGNASATSTPRFTFTTGAGLGGMPAQTVFFSVDSATGPWTRAAGAAPTFTARTAPLADGSHTLYAFAVDASVSGFADDLGTSVVGHMTSYVFAVANACGTGTCADLALTRSTVPAVGFTGKDALYRLRVVNGGPAQATGVILTETIPVGATFVWASPGCGATSNTVACNLGSMANGSTADVTIVLRPGSAGTATSTATVDANQIDPQVDDNRSTANVNVTNPPPANIVPRYRLYSPVSLEHHYTMDANEYAVLGASGAWVQEGQVGNVLDNPGSFNGVQAVPYYRLYNTFTRWHHWTTDPNEYYTLITFPGWGGEDVAGYIFLTQAPGTTQLYRLTYPFIGGLHHWTIDANEYNTLISQYGWVGEGGSGFVIQ